MQAEGELQAVRELVLALRIHLEQIARFVDIAHGDEVVRNAVGVRIGDPSAIIAVLHFAVQGDQLVHHPCTQVEAWAELPVVLTAQRVALLQVVHLGRAVLALCLITGSRQDVVLIVVVVHVRGAERGLDVALLVQLVEVAEAGERDLVRHVGILGRIREEISAVQLRSEEVDTAHAAHAEELEAAQFALAEVQFETQVLEVGFGAGARSGQAGQTIAVAHQIAALLLAVHRPFGHQFSTCKGRDLSGELVLVGVAVAEFHIKDRGIGVAIFRRERTGEEITCAQQVGVQGAHRPTRCAERGEMVGGTDGQSFHAPEQAARAVAAYDDVVARVVGPADPSEVRREPGHVVASTTVARDLFQAEGARAHFGEVVDRPVLLAVARYHGGVQLFHRPFETDLQDHLLPGGHQHIGHGDVLITNEAEGQRVPT